MMIAYGKITFSLRFIVFTEGLGPPRTREYPAWMRALGRAEVGIERAA